MGDRKPNRLISEKSPYLLQHAYNPVAWHPWDREAFEKARKENKPIFLSIGYSTCHWCHVMEEESFSNTGIASILNEFFVPVKVDREERPDVDQVYMESVMAMTGSGGWPLSVFLTPSLEPFYGGTYFPPDDQYGRPGFSTLLVSIAKKWEENPDKVKAAGRDLAQAIQDHVQKQTSGRELLSPALLDDAHHQFSARFDSRHGGFGGAPKFPASHGLSFLLYYFAKKGNSRARDMVTSSLDAMGKGGIYDHVGGGFHRYSTDEMWHVPHFEKMLYDQALLARTYTEAFQATGNEEYSSIALETFQYVLRDLTHKEGGFYSAEDADSAPEASKPGQKTEGAFYTWDAGELRRLLGEENFPVVRDAFGVAENGNVKTDPHGEFSGKNILYRAITVPELARAHDRSVEDVEEIIAKAKKRMFERREERLRPHLDDKILADWNGLMIGSLAYGFRVFNKPSLLDAARKAADFAAAHMYASGGIIYHRWREGEAAIEGFLDDYAFLGAGFLELYEACFEARYLEMALEIAENMVRRFLDKKEGGFFFTSHEGEKLISKQKPVYDGAVPSGNSVAICLLARLGRLTSERRLEQHAKDALEAFSAQLASQPSLYPAALTGFGFLSGPSREIVISGGSHSDPEAMEFKKTIFAKLIPDCVISWYPHEGEERVKIERLIPPIQDKKNTDGKPQVYVCENYACLSPVSTPEELKKLLGHRV